MRNPLIEPFQLSNLFQRPSDHRMVNVQLFGNFSCSCKMISFNNCCQLVVVNFRWLDSLHLIFKALVYFAKLLELLLHCIFISSSWGKCIVDTESCLCCFMILSEFKKKKKRKKKKKKNVKKKKNKKNQKQQKKYFHTGYELNFPFYVLK